MQVEIGTVEPNTTAIVRWWFLSEQSGIFNKYVANFVSLNGLGHETLSIIDNLKTSELVRNVRLHNGRWPKKMSGLKDSLCIT